MARIFLALILLIPLSAAGLWLRDYPGTIDIAWMGYRISLSAMAAALILLVLMVLVMVISVLVHGLMAWPAQFRTHNQLSRYEHGLDYITRGLSAYAMGDSARALKELKKASRALPKSPLPHLLAAQSGAQLNDEARSKPHLMALLEHPATAYIGFKRLLEQAKNSADTELYNELLNKARKQFPHDFWLAERFVAWCVLQQNISAARNYLERFSLRHTIDRSRRKSLLHSLNLAELRAQHNTHAEDYARFLNDESTHDVAALSVAQFTTSDELRTMLKRLVRAVKKSPSYGVQYALITLLARADAESILATKKSLGQSRLALGALKPLADYLEALSNKTPAKAIEGVWQCTVCHHIHAHWHAACHACDALESIHYKTKDDAYSQALSPITA